MKTLYLVRHAKSSWKYPKLDDFERPLNKRGRKSAPFMGEILNKLKVSPDHIISSPANRAATTARIMAAKIGYPLEHIQYSENIYEFSEGALIRVVKGIDDKAIKAMVVGHNPGLNGLANYLGDRPVSNIPTAGIYCLDLDIASWSSISENCGELKFFEYQKKHTG
ncbi:MAG: histidine phosphatase family protein [Deltaproteobacteria bacterium]|jgi:phosphohistidine phosphatase|nr:histidine phosphatase family protein [Deltaproteobacteria bacterium]